MAANLGQAFLGGGGINPSLAQELAAGNFHETRESFHDYIYSKLILGEDKGGSISNASPAVFPNTNLANSYPASLPPPGNLYNHAMNNSNIVGNLGGAGSTSNKGFVNPSQGGSPVNSHKPASSKKKSSLAHTSTPTHMGQGSLDSPTKVKKKSHHKKKEKTNVCDVCGRGFAEKYTLNRHMLTHTHVKPFSCSKCNMSFSRSDGLAKHMAAGHRRIDAHHCDVCGGTFNSEVSFEQHRREYGNTLPFVCNLCMLAFSQCCHLNYHMKSHSLSKMNDNFIASVQEDKNNAIDVSELIPEDFTPPKKGAQKDNYSGFLYKAGGLKRNGNSLDLMDPNIVIKPEIEDMPTCSALASQIVGAGNASLASSLTFEALNSHQASQLNLTTSQGNSGSTPSYLPDTSAGTSGVNTISDIDMKKYFDIKIPNPKFMEGSDGHHTGVGEDGLFRCEICGKGFTRKYHMQRHVKLHTRGPIPKAHLLDWTRRPYACGVCKMGFTRQHHLTRHMLIHTGERPHSCHVCGKAFRRYTNLSLHVRTVHGAERPFKCHICGRGFPRLYSLQRHLKLHAKNAASLAQAADEQMYKDFKPVGTVNLENTHKPTAYGAGNADAARPSSGHSRESSSDHSDDSERYDHESDHHDDNIGNIDPDGHSASPLQEHRVYNQSQGDAFNPQQSSQPSNQSAINSQSSSSSQLSQGTARISQQNSRPGSHEQEIMNQAGRISRHEVEGMRRPTPIHNQGGSDYNSAAVMQTSNNERYNTPTSIPNQNIRNIDMPVSLANFSEIDMRREAAVYSLSQRGGADGFGLHQQRIQSPHPMMTNLERPGSRSMMTQQGAPDGFHHNSSGFTQQQVSLPAQQRVSMDLSSTRNTLSPAGIRDPSVYHHIDMGGSRGGMNDPPAYPHPHSIGSLPFTSLYQQQQQLTDNLNHMELHPNPAASPMPVNTHNTNIQY